VPALASLAAGGAALAVFLRVVAARRARVYSIWPPTDEFRAWVDAHLVWAGTVFGLGLLAVAALWIARGTRAVKALCAALLVLVFLPSGWLLRNYNPTIDERFFFPRTAAVTSLQEHLKGERLVIFGKDTLPPVTNVVYEVPLLTNYDALGIRRFDALYDAFFGLSDNWRHSLKCSGRGLRLFGVEHVLTKGSWIPVDTNFGGFEWNTGKLFRVGRIMPGDVLVQTFTAIHDDLQAVLVPVTTYGCANQCTLRFELYEEGREELLAEGRVDCRDLVEPPRSPAEVVFTFEPIADSFGKNYRIELSSPDARPGNAVGVWASQEYEVFEDIVLRNSPYAPFPEYVPGTLTWRGERLAGGMTYDCAYNRDDFEPIATLAGFELSRYAPGIPRYHVVHRATAVASPEAALAAVRDPSFEPAESVVLEIDAPSPVVHGNSTSRVEIQVEEPALVRLSVSSDERGYLVVARPWFPGWRAEVDGREAPILRANYAFGAVEIDAGEHAVTLVYEPDSFRRGVWISLASALGLGVLGLLGRRLSFP
jgi:hypothetical protein